VDAVPYSNPDNYVRYSGRLAEELAKTEPNGAIWANQFDNIANREAHYRTTGPEIFAQTDGKVDGFICAVGSGGTLAGVAQALRERKPSVQIGLADPHGAALYSFYKDGELKSEGKLDQRGHRPGPHHRQSRRPGRRPPVPDQRRGDAGGSSISSSRRACAWAARRASTSPARSVWPRPWVPATPS
jgi:cysteine synthase